MRTTSWIVAWLMLAGVWTGAWAAGVEADADELVKKYPPTFRWDDRRPILALFLAASGKNWPANPRGYFRDEKMDITTDAGRALLRERLLKLADDAIACVKAVDAQGVIVWDIEGGEMPHAVTYLGDPRILPKVAPEMDALADEFFQRFRAAGIRTGVCIRPTSIVFKDPNDPSKYPWIKGRYGHIDNDDPVGVLSDKISYARKRWDCTIFYMDTNVTPKRVNGQLVRKPTGGVEVRLLTAEEIRALHQKHPDALIFPEFQEPGYFASSTGYAEYHSVGDFSADVRVHYPQAFRVWMPRLYPDDVYQKWDDFLNKGVRAGEVFIFEDLSPDTGFAALLRNAYAEARCTWNPPADLSALLEALKTSPDWAVRRRVIDALGAHPDAAATAALKTIAAVHTDGLEIFAGFSLGRQGTPESFAALTDLLQGKGRAPVAGALGLGRTGKVEAVEPLLALLRQTKDHYARWAALDALGQLRKPEAVPDLIALLKANFETPAGMTRIKTVQALGRIGDARAVPVLIEALSVKSFATIKPQVARALVSITGQKDIKNPQDPRSWQKWLTEHPQPAPVQP